MFVLNDYDLSMIIDLKVVTIRNIIKYNVKNDDSIFYIKTGSVHLFSLSD